MANKKITLHPVSTDGTLDVETNLYPSTLNTSLKKDNGDPFVPQEQLVAGSGITIAADGKTISSTGGENKLDKDTTHFYHAYGVNGNGEQYMVPYSINPVAYNLAMYHENGQLTVPYNPAANTDATSKSYVDGGLSSKESILNKVTTLDGLSTDTQYPSAKCVYDQLTIIRNIAEGKTKTFILSYNYVADTDDWQCYRYYACGFENPIAFESKSDFETWLTGKTCKNDAFDSSAARIDSFVAGDYIIINANDDLSQPQKKLLLTYEVLVEGIRVKIGDVFYVIENFVTGSSTEYCLDRWFDGGLTFYGIDGFKNDLSGYATLAGNNTWTGTNNFRQGVTYTNANNVYNWHIGSGVIQGSLTYLAISRNNTPLYYFSGSNFAPQVSGKDLGGSDNKWEDLYLNGSLHIGNTTLNESQLQGVLAASHLYKHDIHINMSNCNISFSAYLSHNTQLTTEAQLYALNQRFVCGGTYTVISSQTDYMAMYIDCKSTDEEVMCSYFNGSQEQYESIDFTSGTVTDTITTIF